MSGAVRMNPVRLPEKIKDLELVGADEYPFAYAVGDVVGSLLVQGKDIIVEGELLCTEFILKVGEFSNNSFRALGSEFIAEDGL